MWRGISALDNCQSFVARRAPDAGVTALTVASFPQIALTVTWRGRDEQAPPPCAGSAGAECDRDGRASGFDPSSGERPYVRIHSKSGTDLVWGGLAVQSVRGLGRVLIEAHMAALGSSAEIFCLIRALPLLTPWWPPTPSMKPG